MEHRLSSINRYVIEYWDAGERKWRSCFNGRSIGDAFVAPVINRKTEKVRLVVLQVKNGGPAILEFAAYNDTTGKLFSVPRGQRPEFVGE